MIRRVEGSDADAWAAMRARLWPETDPRGLADEARAFIAGRTVIGLTVVFIAVSEEAVPVGFLELFVREFSDGCDSMPVPHVEGWYVEPDARGKGNGRRLMRSAERWARARGFTELASDAEISNDASLRAHARCGFEEVERLVKFRKALG